MRAHARADGWLGEGIATVIVATDVGLFEVREPATSMLGAVLVAVGLVVLLFHRLAPGP